MSNTKRETAFKGYTSPKYTQIPDLLFDEQLPDLSGAELKVLLYIMRRTFGFKKDHDNISLGQIMHGITTRDGRTLDRGTGLSKDSVVRAIKSLEEQGLILRQRRSSSERGDEATNYALNVGSVSENRTPTPVSENQTRGGPKIGRGRVWFSDTQETVEQETDQQQTGIYSNETDSNSFLSKYGDAGLSTVARARGSVDNREAGEGPAQRPASTAGAAVIVARVGLGRGRPPKAPEQLGAAMEDVSFKLHDAAPRSSLTRATKLWKASGLPVDKFCQRAYEARSAVRQVETTKASAAGDGTRNRMPLFFAELERRLGFRDEQDWSVRHAPPGL